MKLPVSFRGNVQWKLFETYFSFCPYAFIHLHIKIRLAEDITPLIGGKTGLRNKEIRGGV